MGQSATWAAVAAAIALIASRPLARLVLGAPAREAPFAASVRTARPSRALVGATGLTCALSSALCGWAVGWSLALPAFVLLGLISGVLALIDVRTHRLPNRLVLPLAAALPGALLIALLGRAGMEDWLRALMCGAAVYLAMAVLRLIAPAGLGYGDVKLAGVLGVALGWQAASAAVWGVFAAFTLGALVSLVLLVGRKATLRTAVPFGPSLVGGALLVCAVYA